MKNISFTLFMYYLVYILTYSILIHVIVILEYSLKIIFFVSEKYPQIKKLFGYDPNFKWIVTCMVLVQFLSFFIVKDLSYPKLLILAYCFGGVINHSLMLGMYIFALM